MSSDINSPSQETTPHILAGSLSGTGVEVPGLSLWEKELGGGDLEGLREALRPKEHSKV